MKKDNKIFVTRPVLPPRDEFHQMCDEIFDSEWLTNMGEKHNLLETRLKEYLSVDNMSLFNNGTNALLAALKALELPAGSEVITTPFTFAATTHVIEWNGLKPIFADICPKKMVLDIESVKKAITPNTSAILAVHVYGFPCYVNELEAIAKQYGLKIVYDGAHSFNTRIDGKPISEWGDVTMLSFHSTKLFNTIEGGALIYNCESLRTKINDLRNFGFQNEVTVNDVGINGKLNEIQSAVGLLNLEILDDEIKCRMNLEQFYRENLAAIPQVSVPNFDSGESNSYQYFPILVDSDRDGLYEHLKENDIYARRYFYPLCSEFAPYRNLESAQPENLPVATNISRKVLCLPFYGRLFNDERKHDIINLIKEFYA